LHEDALTAGVLGCAVGPGGPAAALRIGTGDGHAHRRAALHADEDDILLLLRTGGDRTGHGGGEAAAVPAERRGVVLLTYRPEPVQPGEGELGAGHLLDAPALRAQHIHDRGVHARAVRTLTHLGVLVKQAMCHERHAHGPSIRLRLWCGGWRAQPW